MILTNDIKEIVYALANKQGHATISPDDFSRYAQMANMDEYQEYTSGIETYYSLGKAMPKVSPGMNKIMDMKLSPFLVTDATMAIISGVAVFPSNIEFLDRISGGSKQAKWVAGHMVQRYLESSIDTPDIDNPIFTFVAGGIRLYPSSVVPKVTFLKTPAIVRWGYTLLNGRKPIYDASTSVNFEWGAVHRLSLVTKILGYMGISIRDMELKSLAISEEQKSSK